MRMYKNVMHVRISRVPLFEMYSTRVTIDYIMSWAICQDLFRDVSLYFIFHAFHTRASRYSPFHIPQAFVYEDPGSERYPYVHRPDVQSSNND